MRTIADLTDTLHRLDGRGYKGYRDIKGSWQAPDGVVFSVDHVQSDPFANPSKVRLIIPTDLHRIPATLHDSRIRTVALCDHLLRIYREATRGISCSGSGKSGMVVVDAGDAEVLPRSACEIDGRTLEVRFRVGLPARGRSIAGHAAASLLAELVEASSSLMWEAIGHDEARAFVNLVEDHRYLQMQLEERGLVTFVRDGSNLPRISGISSRPLRDAVLFQSPEELRVTLDTRHHGPVTGMGIPHGVTLITGGGFHGKTTLLEAIELGVYPHAPGDGREWVVTRRDAVKVRSEDGRAVTAIDLRPFIHDLPRGKTTARFETQDASGSTSLAAAILESLEVGSRMLLLDEDTCATNLLIRDARMQRLVARETIVPFIDRVRELHETLGVSTILVLGGSGDYLDVADLVIMLEEYLPKEVTGRARAVAAEIKTERSTGEEVHALTLSDRKPIGSSFDPRRGEKEKVRSHGLRELVYGRERIDLSALEQLVDDSQARAIGVLMRELQNRCDGEIPMKDVLEEMIRDADERGLWALDQLPELAMPRVYELAAAVNRLRNLKVN